MKIIYYFNRFLRRSLTVFRSLNFYMSWTYEFLQRPVVQLLTIKIQFLDVNKKFRCWSKWFPWTRLYNLNLVWLQLTKVIRRFLSSVRAGVVKNPDIQCTRMKLLTQPATFVICQISMDFFWLKVSLFTENKAVWLKNVFIKVATFNIDFASRDGNRTH